MNRRYRKTIIAGGHLQLPLLQALAHTDDGDQAGLNGGMDLLVHGKVGLIVVLPALGVADNDVLENIR